MPPRALARLALRAIGAFNPVTHIEMRAVRRVLSAVTLARVIAIEVDAELLARLLVELEVARIVLLLARTLSPGLTAPRIDRG